MLIHPPASTFPVGYLFLCYPPEIRTPINWTKTSCPAVRREGKVRVRSPQCCIGVHYTTSFYNLPFSKEQHLVAGVGIEPTQSELMRLVSAPALVSRQLFLFLMRARTSSSRSHAGVLTITPVRKTVTYFCRQTINTYQITYSLNQLPLAY